jgi:glycosyltransferase involved in cell wall biosynthesis
MGLILKPESFKTEHVPGLVSVVLPVYNQAYLLGGSIKSVLKQTYTHLELIIVNDGSTDEVEKILGPYREHPKVKILDQENQKLPRALSNGFRSARGELYTWTSADNLMGPRQLEVQVEFLARRPDTQMVYANYDIINDEGEPLLYSDHCPGYQRPPGSNHIHLPQDLGELNVIRNNYIGPCFMYRSWVGRLIGGYDATMFTVEDYDYWMAVNAFFRTEHLGQEDPLYFNRVHADSLTGRIKELKIVENTDRLMEFEKVRREFYREKFNIYLLGNNDRLKEIEGPLRANGNWVRPFRIPCGETRMERGKALGLWIESAIEKGFVRRVMAENPHAFFVVLRLDPEGSVDQEFLRQFGMRVAITDKIPGSDQGEQWFFAEELTSILYPVLCKANIELFRREDSFARWTV